MVDVPSLLAFVLAASTLTVTTGVDTAMDGRRPAVMATLGIALGCFARGTAAAFGLVRSWMFRRPHTHRSSGWRRIPRLDWCEAVGWTSNSFGWHHS